MRICGIVLLLGLVSCRSEPKFYLNFLVTGSNEEYWVTDAKGRECERIIYQKTLDDKERGSLEKYFDKQFPGIYRPRLVGLVAGEELK